MSITHKLFRTDGGVELCPEICLRVAEELAVIDPRSIASLLLTSKSLYTILKAYEKSVCKSALNKDHRYSWVNVEQHEVLSSRMPLGTHAVTSYTYAWICEMQSRVKTTEFLLNHELTDMIDSQAQSWPTLNISKTDLGQRVERFKRISFQLLYRLADCSTSLADTLKVRAQQAEFLESLRSADLASLGVIVEVMGQNYFTMTKKTIHTTASTNVWATGPTQAGFFIPSTVRSEDISSDDSIRECMCVFEDLTQRFGPYFPFAFVEGGKNRVLRPDLWAQTMLQEGLDNMNAYELGYTMSFASLQSVVWRVFCRKEGCTLLDSWSAAREIIESEMQGYEIDCEK